MIIVTFDARVAAADREEVLASARRAITSSRAEPGCVSYDVLADIDDSNRIIWVEQWQDAESHVAHQSNPDVQKFMAESASWGFSGRLTIHTVTNSQELTLPGN